MTAWSVVALAARASRTEACPSEAAADARRVAGMLDIPFYVLNFQDDFGRVIDYFVDEYNRGRTPNPCVRCNDWLKFGKLAKYAEAVGADFVASGHYARTAPDPATALENASRLMRLAEERDAFVIWGHGPEQWPTLRKAPAFYD